MWRVLVKPPVAGQQVGVSGRRRGSGYKSCLRLSLCLSSQPSSRQVVSQTKATEAGKISKFTAYYFEARVEMKLSIFVLVFVVTYALGDHEFRLYNKCPFTVWVGALNNPNKALPENGGFPLKSWQSRSVFVPNGWGGRFWGRTDCDSSGKCITGDCGNRLQCQGAGGVPPVTLAEFTLDGWPRKLDYYDVSLVDGYNLPMQIKPINGFQKNSNSKYDCTTAGCNADLNARCPSELAIKKGEWTVACKSACEAFRSDIYCCRGAHNRPETCKSNTWPKNYAAIFKSACPDAYSYAYDDQTSTFTCQGPKTGYEISFCP